MNRLDGKVALISGAARGIGGETARLMVEAGATVTIGDVLDERGRETARTLGDTALYVHLDVTSEEDWNAAVAAALGRFGKLRRAVERAATVFGANPEDLEKLERWKAIVTLIRESRVEVDLRKPQNEYYRMRKTVRPMIAASAGNGAPYAGRWLQHFDALGEKLSISPEPQA